MRRSTEVSLYVDTMIVETLLADSHLTKTAQTSGIISGLIAKIKDYFGNHVDQDDKVGSVVNMLAPGAITVTLGALGLPWIGTFLGLALRIFNINTSNIFKDIWNSIGPALKSGKQVSSEQVDTVVDNAVGNHAKPATEEEAAQAEQLIKKKSSDLLREARLFKLAMMEYKRTEGFTKDAGILDWFSKKKGASASFLSIILKWVFKIGLASAGLMVAGDLVNKFLDRPNAIDGTIQNGKPTNSVAIPTVTSRQTRFKPNPNYRPENRNPNDSWILNVQNNQSAIASMLVGWAKEVYQGLDGLETLIQSTAGFGTMLESISWQNQAAEGGPIISIPSQFTSKKSVVDHFIDEVAEKAPK